MMQNYLRLMAMVISLFVSTVWAAPETLLIDNQHSTVIWSIKHLGFSTQSGKWYVNGDLVIDKDHLNKSKVNVTINIDDLVTGLPELDKHLKGKLFFDTAQFPKATFVSDRVQVLSPNTAKVFGKLTLHGVTKQVTLNVTMNKVGVNPLTDRRTAGFSATTTIKRSDFGMNSLLPDLGDVVTLRIDVEAYQDNTSS